MMRSRALLLLGGLTIAGCGGEEGSETGAGTADSAATVTDTATAGMQHGAAQDADHEFLRMMSDHHEGLVAMGMDAMNRAQDDSVKSAAHRLHEKQAMERDSMVVMIQQMYNEQHRPTIIPKNQAQADSLRQMSGQGVDRYFLQTTIAHHREGIQMIDQHLPRLAKPQVRQMAEKMRAEQQKEIQELEGKLSSL